ncbi:hypothetical protein M431DRAFT_476759 [Trichoderma harzianum CBS 226.95]|uniref:Uncharacterized protein n=1 Tax=Trichoderma harzianum CBS 226.95 TaxID=983964 RepID=A0A2T4AT50_TRIHA|nr:hypothetical protein M431DRAFT_476759 [Trichoderma harzianum CBS 226.95]PTB60242.1 hypothetical protein M431DRAFT_476759 [Trichoderma harzianum CBS 226.95]
MRHDTVARPVAATTRTTPATLRLTYYLTYRYPTQPRLQANPILALPISSIFPSVSPPCFCFCFALPFCFAATTPSAAMSGSDVDAANPQKEAPAPPSSSGSGISIKKRKKDGLKPIITMEGPPSQRPADADAASGTGTGKASKSQDSTDMHE